VTLANNMVAAIGQRFNFISNTFGNVNPALSAFQAIMGIPVWTAICRKYCAAAVDSPNSSDTDTKTIRATFWAVTTPQRQSRTCAGKKRPRGRIQSKGANVNFVGNFRRVLKVWQGFHMKLVRLRDWLAAVYISDGFFECFIVN